MRRAPNLIFFLSDNHNASVAGCYGHPVVRTPTLDRIAARGARFDRAYCASPLCCPSRAAIASGRFPHQTGYWDNCLAYDGRVASWGHRVREAGGTAVSIGKLHFRSSDDDNGFDEEIAPMHIVGGTGSLAMLLRWNGKQPPLPGQWDLYWEDSGVGETEYQDYDRAITGHAVDWLHNVGARLDRPWVLLVSYVSTHPPFRVPQRFFDMYPPAHMPLPVAYRPGERPEHPALAHLRDLKVYQAMDDPQRLRRVAAGYFGLVTHLDEQIGEVMRAAEGAGLLGTTHVMYTSDHGESYGHHGIFGKNHLLEPAARVPLLMCGPGIEAGRVVQQPASGVDLFPTIVEAVGGTLQREDADIAGQSLWPALHGDERARTVFAEYHASASRNASYLWRDGDEKLIYHVDARPQFYDLGQDPFELEDLGETAAGRARAARLETALRRELDPEATDARAKADQHAMLERCGGAEAALQAGTVVYTPPPGQAARLDRACGRALEQST